VYSDASLEVLANSADLEPTARRMNQAWVMWQNLILCPQGVPLEMVEEAELLLQALAGRLTSAQFARCTASRRENSPLAPGSTPQPGIVGKLVGRRPRPATSE
jgi:hypothetical protein